MPERKVVDTKDPPGRAVGPGTRNVRLGGIWPRGCGAIPVGVSATVGPSAAKGDQAILFLDLVEKNIVATAR